MKAVIKLTKGNRLTMHRKVKLGKHIRFVKDIERRLYEAGYWKQEDYWDAVKSSTTAFVNIETDEVYTESEIRNLYEEFKADWSKTEKEIYSDFDYWLNSALDKNGSLRRI